MKNLFILAVTCLALLPSCGSGGGGESGSSSAAAATASITNKVWAIPVTTGAYGSCAIAAKFSDSMRFGFTYICEAGGNSFVYEAAYGSYSISGQKIVLKADPDYCSSFDSIFWDPSNLSHTIELTYSLSEKSLSLRQASTVLNFLDVTGQTSGFPFIAARGCYVKSSNVYSWIPYMGSFSNEDVLQDIEKNTIVASGNQKPKIDIIVFQDDSDSIIRNGPLATLKPQLASFLSNMSNEWDYRFTVMPLLTTNLGMSSKYVVSNDCSSVSNVMGCLAPSQVATFNNSSGDYGWINSANFVGGDDRGFQTMQTHIERMKNSGFLRTDAALAIIVVSNADDLEGVSYATRADGVVVRQYDTASENSSFNSYYSYFSALKGTDKLISFFPVVVSSSGACLNGFSGKRYVEMANALNSRSYNICGGELNSSLNDVKQQLLSIKNPIRFDYSVVSTDRQPLVSSIRVTKNGQLVPQSSGDGWSYVGYTTQATSYFPVRGNIRAGYMIKMNGAAAFGGADQIQIEFVAQ